MNTVESKYIEKKAYLSRYSNERVLALREAAAPVLEIPSKAEWARFMKGEATAFIPFLKKKCGLDFRGRILEIGAGRAWFSAELSKLPNVVDVITTDISPRLLKEHAPKTFEMLKANRAKITRMPGDFHKLDFPDNYFDYVVCSAVLVHAVNVVQVLREAKRMLKSGGRFVAIREPILPLAKLKSRAKKDQGRPATYTLGHYKELFKQAALPLEVKPVNLSSGFKYYLNKMVNGLTHARYVFVGTKRSRSAR
jgi:ubiquinone/menaquinone biosynthesis C-methylase UbiE